MKRLTKRDRGGNALLNCEDCDEKGRGHCGTIPCRNQLVQRLADFEEFGLEPADFKNILEEFVELKKAEADGRLVVLPCKVDDTLYEIDLPEYGVITCKVLRVLAANQRYANATEGEIIRAVSVLVRVTEGHGEGSSYEFCEEDFGKTVFFSREEAEAVLKKNLPRYDDDMTRPSGLLEDD